MTTPRLRVVLAVGTVVLAACTTDGPDPAVIERGAALYESSCVQCHGGPEGGTISDIPPRHNREGRTWHHPDCQLTDIIRDGLPPRPGAAGTDREMPAFDQQLDDDEIDAILAYIKTWWTNDQRAFQAEVTADKCGAGLTGS